MFLAPGALNARGLCVTKYASTLRCKVHERKEDAMDGGPAFALHGLTKRFGPVAAVDGVSVEVARGEIVALLGPNGAGKSTTVDMLLGLTKPDAGTVAVGGGSPREAVDRGLVGAMMQNGALLPDVTVGEIVELIVSTHAKPLP